MPEEESSLASRTATALTKLQTSAKQFRPISATVSRAVQKVQRALDELDLHVACWTLISEHTGGDGDSYSREYVGYVEHNGQWQIVLSSDKGLDSQPDQSEETIWPFAEAPQYLRTKAIDKLPELIDSLAATVDKTAERMSKKLEAAEEIAAAVTKSTAKVSR